MTSKHRPQWIGILVALASMAGIRPAVAQTARPDWGGSDSVLYAVGFMEFSPTASSTTYSHFANGRYSTVPVGLFDAAPHLPSGVLLTYLELDYCDSTGAGNVTLVLGDCSFMGANCTAVGSSLSSSNGLAGCSFVSVDLTSAGYTTNNNLRRLLLEAVTQSGDSGNVLLGAYIGYKLQVSPAPASATFLDVPTGHPFFRFVEALADAGITGGCGGNNFCPDAPLTRGQMAVFLSVALGLHFPN